jgi:ribose 5-phosphate isomerase A
VSDTAEAHKRAAAERAVDWVSSGMVVGLGTGSTAVWAVRRIGALLAEGSLRDISGVPTALQTAEEARRAGIPLLGDDVPWQIDVTIDGADEVDPQLGLIKGGGAALLREKIVVSAAERFVVVAETKKKVSRLGETRGLPVEVVRFGWRDTRRRLLELVAGADLRIEDGAPVVTDEGHLLLDCALPSEGDLGPLAAAIKATVGVVEHGLFLGAADEVLLGTPEGEVETLRL